MSYGSMDAIKAANRRAGQYWFEPDTMRFFGSRAPKTVIEGRYFISSEQREPYTERCYTIRVALDDGSIETVGKFMGFDTRKAARDSLNLALPLPVEVRPTVENPREDYYVWQVAIGSLEVATPRTRADAEAIADQLRTRA